jgi:hypothetical protein
MCIFFVVALFGVSEGWGLWCLMPLSTIFQLCHGSGVLRVLRHCNYYTSQFRIVFLHQGVSKLNFLSINSCNPVTVVEVYMYTGMYSTQC